MPDPADVELERSSNPRDARVVAHGVVRVGNDVESDLRVKLLLAEGKLALLSEILEVGTWPVESVTIVRVDGDRYEFTADDDTIAFFPDDPAHFSQLSIVSEPARKRRHHRKRNGSRSSRPQPAVPEPERNGKRRRREEKAERRRVREEEKERKEEEQRRRREEKAERRRVREEEKDRKEEEERRRRREEKAERRRVREEKAERQRRREERKRQKQSGSDGRRTRKPAKAAAKLAVPARRPRRARRSARFAETWEQRWHPVLHRRMRWARWRARLGFLWMLDQLRQTDVYLLDRIPVVTDEMRLEPGHKHTYQPRRGTAGLTRYVCTGCRKLRLSPPTEADLEADETDA